MNLTMFRTILRSEGWPRSVYLDPSCHEAIAAAAELITCIPIPRCLLKFGGNPTTGFAAVVLLLSDSNKGLPRWWPHCGRVHLYGFGDVDASSAPYHYWMDGSLHDGHNSSEWYQRPADDGTRVHDYGREQSFLRVNLSGTSFVDGPFVITRAAVSGWCADGIHELDSSDQE
jgi:hypothetical protein